FPAAERSGGKSRNSVVYMRPFSHGPLAMDSSLGRGHLPVGARLGSVADEVFQGLGISCLHHVLERIERMAEANRLLQHFFLVSHQNVAPYGWVAGGDAGEVPKPGACQR